MKRFPFLLAFFISGIVTTGVISWTTNSNHNDHVFAITNNGTKNSLPAIQLPSGYTRPTVTTFTNYEYTRVLTLTVSKDSVQNASASTTMTNIFTHSNVGLNKQITDILAGDFLSSATVTAYADLVELNTNMRDVGGSSAALTNAATSYVCKVILYVKAL